MLLNSLKPWLQCVVISVLMAPGCTLAHPNHSSLTEITWKNSAQPTGANKTGVALSGTLQIALQVIPEDLEAALQIHEQRPVVLNDNPQTDQAIVNYLWQFFRVRNQSGAQLPIHWLGKQVSHKGAWLYFEIPVKQARVLTLEHTVLMDYQRGQTNRVNAIINGHQQRYTFTPARPSGRLWGQP